MSTTAAEQSKFRLPTNVRPTHYDVTIQTDLEKLTFSGFVKISLDVKEETKDLVLHSAALELSPARVYSEALKTEQTQSGQSFEESQERLTVSFPNALPAGSKALLTIPFHGPLTGNLMGYYKSTWEDEGVKKSYALTQFEPTAARRAFPCWDEPLLKATFAITLVSRSGTVSLANMNDISEIKYSGGSALPQDADMANLLKSTCAEGDWIITKFATTPPMSSYIVAWANGEFEHLSTTVKLPVSGKELPLRIFATKDNIHQAEFALEVKAKVLPLYEQVFEVGYPLPKLDTLVASDFDAGAMENWGLITGRTSVFLLDPKRADVQSKAWVATVQSHEVAHMWFGNITTMKWWDNLYLNEGFATLMGEVIITDKVFPEWKLTSEFIGAHLSRALSLDAKLSSHPIEVDCPDANRINQIFDALSYSKAASVLRMLAAHVGEDKFLKGVSLYLKDNLFGNSVTEDLWKGISTATGTDVVALMTNWVNKIGFPVITVSEDANGIKVRQDRFIDSGAAEAKDNETIWNVPLAILTRDASGKAIIDRPILGERESSYAVDTSKPFKLNAGTAGVYHVLYTPERLTKIAKEAAREDSLFTLDDRMGLVYDTFATSKAGLSKLSSSLTLVDILKNEQEYLVWDSIASNLGGLTSIWWEHQDVVDQLKAFRRSLFVPLVDKLEYEYPEGESTDKTQLRTLAVGQAASSEDPKVIAELKRRFEPFLKSDDDSLIPADLVKTIFAQAVKNGGRAEFDKMKQVVQKPKTPTYGIAAMQAMCSSRDPKLLEEATQYALNDSRDQDVMYYFRGLQGNPAARRMFFNTLKAKYDVICKRFEGNFSLGRIIQCPIESLSTKEDYDEIKAFFADKDTSKFDLSLAQSLDGVKARYTYIGRSTDDLKEWLDHWNKPKL
ncbi:peptidase family M1-domain-containing protein [Schizophyllum amplum]|uniref:Aminopeptidase n=1 Tax=Schizophyllum amplum TaxID=97359 RepID=A0A550CAD5_9AGAR|nr:peptidase family M1-domain-containing protein [Auriculariopsis ampla]